MAKPQEDQGGTGRRYNRPADEAKRLGISRRQIGNWQRDRTIPFIKRGRVILFDPVAVDEALERFENRPTGEGRA
jgi:excisionase family DNA binding protein